MKPHVVIARAIGLPLIALGAIFVGTHCNKTDKGTERKIEKPSVQSVEKKDIETNDSNSK